MIVSTDGKGDFSSICDAIASIPENNRQRSIIFIKNGIYKEKLLIEKPLVTLIGEDPLHTVVTFDDSENKLTPDGQKMGVFNSYTAFIGADNFRAENLTFENAAAPGKESGQAIAAYVDADRITFKNCRFLGRQDTLFTGPLPQKELIPGSFRGPREKAPRRNGRHYYENCFIQGSVDLIFGSATAYFAGCEIRSLSPDTGEYGYITAASTPENRQYGYVFLNCRLTGDCAPRTVYLGRPWREHAHVAYINCSMGAHIRTEGWHNGNKPGAEHTVKFAEFNSTGPGGTMDKRVRWAKVLKPERASQYSQENVLHHCMKGEWV